MELTTYSLEEIYNSAGRYDKIASIDFIPESESFKIYGENITIMFVYTPKEREDFEEKLNAQNPINTNGFVKAKILRYETADDIKHKALKEGFQNKDIRFMMAAFPAKNQFLGKDDRTIEKIRIEMPLSNPIDAYPRSYSDYKKDLSNGIGLTPNEAAQYFALKFFFDPSTFNESEIKLASIRTFKEDMEYEMLSIKYYCKIISDEEKEQLLKLLGKRKVDRFELLNNKLQEAGSSIKKMLVKTPEIITELRDKILKFHELRLNLKTRVPIYLDLEGFIHILLRHVKNYELPNNVIKDNFQWDKEDIVMVIKKIIRSHDNEIQQFWIRKPNKKYSKYGPQSLYFEGDYYEFHIEGNGRLETFYRKKKNGMALSTSF